jgi:hypothetical protein
MNHSGDITGPLGSTDIGGDNHNVIDFFPIEIITQQIDRSQFIDRYVEKTLNLGSVEVDRKNAPGTGDGKKVGYEPRRNRYTGLVFPVAPTIAEERDYRSNPSGGSAFQGINHDKHF